SRGHARLWPRRMPKSERAGVVCRKGSDCATFAKFLKKLRHVSLRIHVITRVACGVNPRSSAEGIHTQAGIVGEHPEIFGFWIFPKPFPSPLCFYESIAFEGVGCFFGSRGCQALRLAIHFKILGAKRNHLS